MLIIESKREKESLTHLSMPDPELLKKEAKGKRRHTTHQRAKKLALLYKVLKPQVAELRKFVKDQGYVPNEHVLQSYTGARTKYDWISYVTLGYSTGESATDFKPQQGDSRIPGPLTLDSPAACSWHNSMHGERAPSQFPADR